MKLTCGSYDKFTIFFIIDDQGNVKQKRTSMRVIDIWQLEENLRVLVTPNEVYQPIKKSASIFASFLRSVARDCTYCPLNYERWQIFPQELKSVIKDLVMVRIFK